MKLPPNPLVVERRVDFSQTDAAGIIHFSTYFVFMEVAEAELFRRLGLELLSMEAGRAQGFPRVDCQCRFRRPVSFDARVRIELSIEKILSGRIRYAFRFLAESGELCAEGSMVTACAVRREDGSLEAAVLPENVRSSLEDWKNQAG